MKKFLKLFFVFLLIFSFTFTIKALEEDPEVPIVNEEQPEEALITEAPVVSVKGNNNTLTVSWTSDENAVKYIVYRSTDAKKGFKVVYEGTNLTFANKKLEYGKTYYFKVKAVGASNNKTSAVVSKKVAVNKVTNVNAKPASTSVKLTWDKTAPTGYYILQSTDNKKWTKVATISKNSTTSYTVKKLKAKKTYYYQVQAYYKSGKTIKTGKKSDVVKVKTLFTLPTVKLDVTGIYNIDVKIKELSDVQYFEVYTSDKEDGEYELYSNTYPYYYDGYSYTSYYTSEPATQVFFKVRACQKETYCSSYVKLNAKTKLSKPEIYTIRGGSKYAELSFYANDSTSSSIFEVYRATSKNGKYTKVGTVTADTYPFTFKDKKVSNGKTYYYKVRLISTINDKKYTSSYSKVLSVKTGKGAEVISAMYDAKRVNKEWPYSKAYMVEILMDFGYTKDQAKKGISNAKINFKDNAYKAGKYYIKYFGIITEEGLRKDLSTDGFTEKEIVYALNKLKINWKKRLKEEINNELKWGVSRQSLVNYYATESFGLTEAQVNTVIDEMNIDFGNQALIALRQANYDYNVIYDRPALINLLLSYQFTNEEAEYAVNNADFDYASQIITDYYNNNGATQNLSKAEFIKYYTETSYSFTEDDVLEAIDILGLDFELNAIEVAQEIEANHYSRSALINILVNERLFTNEEAEYAADNSGFDYDQECANYLTNISNGETFDSEEIVINLLKEAGFTDENIDYAFENTDIMDHIV